MKIKLSKSQWQNIGKTAGWMKNQNNDLPKSKEINKDKIECPYCKKQMYIESLSNQKGQSLCIHCKKPFQAPSRSNVFL